MGHTVIQIPVPPLERVVRQHIMAANPEMRILGNATMCAHITLLGPFVHRRDVTADLLAVLRDLLAPAQAFPFELSQVDRFPGGPVYLTPSPVEPFQRLTELLWRAFPDWPPYGGAFDDLVPHLSIGSEIPEVELDLLQKRLPIATSADEVTLTWWSDDAITTLATFPLARGEELETS